MMAGESPSFKRFSLLALVLVLVLFGLSNIDELTGQATGGTGGGCGGGLDEVALTQLSEDEAAAQLLSCAAQEQNTSVCTLILPQIEGYAFQSKIGLPKGSVVKQISCFDDAGNNPCAQKVAKLSSGHTLVANIHRDRFSLLSFAFDKARPLNQNSLIEVEFSSPGEKAFAPGDFKLLDFDVVDAKGNSLYRFGVKNALSEEGAEVVAYRDGEEPPNICLFPPAESSGIGAIQGLIDAIFSGAGQVAMACQNVVNSAKGDAGNGLNLFDVLGLINLSKNKTPTGQDLPMPATETDKNNASKYHCTDSAQNCLIGCASSYKTEWAGACASDAQGDFCCAHTPRDDAAGMPADAAGAGTPTGDDSGMPAGGDGAMPPGSGGAGMDGDELPSGDAQCLDVPGGTVCGANKCCTAVEECMVSTLGMPDECVKKPVFGSGDACADDSGEGCGDTIPGAPPKPGGDTPCLRKNETCEGGDCCTVRPSLVCRYVQHPEKEDGNYCVEKECAKRAQLCHPATKPCCLPSSDEEPELYCKPDQSGRAKCVVVPDDDNDIHPDTCFGMRQCRRAGGKKWCCELNQSCGEWASGDSEEARRKKCRSDICDEGEQRCDPDQDKNKDDANVCCKSNEQCNWNKESDKYKCVPRNADPRCINPDRDGDHYCKTVDGVDKCCMINEICVPDPNVEATCFPTAVKLCKDGPAEQKAYLCPSMNPAAICCGGGLGGDAPVCCEDYQRCDKSGQMPKCVTPNN